MKDIGDIMHNIEVIVIPSKESNIDVAGMCVCLL